MLHWLWIAIIGLVIGAIAKLIMPGKDPGGIFITMLLGIAGSLLAGWLGRAIGRYQEGPAGRLYCLDCWSADLAGDLSVVQSELDCCFLRGCSTGC